MILKIFKAVWLVSLFALMASFLFIYASVPEQVVVNEGSGVRMMTREGLFYASLGLFSVCNVLVFIMSALYRNKDNDLLSWFYGLIVCLNIFFIISLNFINLYNSNESYRYGNIGFVIYGSVGLVILWTVSWPFYALTRKKLNKPTA